MNPKTERPVRLACSILLVVTGLITTLTGGLALADDKTFVETLPKRAFEAEDDNRFFTLAVENDSLGSGSDRHYTSGVRATWLNLGDDPSWIADQLMGLFAKGDEDAPSATFYSLGHNLYTPRDIEAQTPDPDDRPYAAFLYGSAGYTKATGNRIDTVEFTLGVVGPWAFGEEIQTAVHDVVSGDDPNGWDAQLDNEPGLILAWERRWPSALQTRFGRINARLMPHVGINLGNVYTHAAVGATWQLVPDNYEWQSPPLRVRPAIPGSGFFYPETDRVGWSAFLGFEARTVARNIFLDGNTFEDSPSVDRETLVYDVNAGFSVAWSKLRVAYTLNWRSDEFAGQRDEQLFGVLSVSRRF